MNNALVNYAPPSETTRTQRFTDVQLANLESTVHVDSGFSKDRDEIGTPIWRSPEAQLGLQWGPPTDIWSFGTTVIITYARAYILIDFNNHGCHTGFLHDLGRQFLHIQTKCPHGDNEYELKILAKYRIYFGPFPPSYGELADKETSGLLSQIMKDVPPEKLRPFSLASQNEISKHDNEFILKILKLDPRDRPTAKDLLEDELFDRI
ncbi:hypothetical protein NYO67_11566 [Aspergillus flavus]|nr:hypothetical protein NYO67_11566 [Aspergillus flavus]